MNAIFLISIEPSIIKKGTVKLHAKVRLSMESHFGTQARHLYIILVPEADPPPADGFPVRDSGSPASQLGSPKPAAKAGKKSAMSSRAAEDK